VFYLILISKHYNGLEKSPDLLLDISQNLLLTNNVLQPKYESEHFPNPLSYHKHVG